MSDSNPVEIAAKAVRDWRMESIKSVGGSCPETVNHVDRNLALAVIAALEREGFPLIRREPTAGMVLAAYKTIHLALASTPMMPMDEYAAVFRIMVDAAPSYATPANVEAGVFIASKGVTISDVHHAGADMTGPFSGTTKKAACKHKRYHGLTVDGRCCPDCGTFMVDPGD